MFGVDGDGDLRCGIVQVTC